MAGSVATIESVRGYENLDSRDNPTVACKITSSAGRKALFQVPSGASTGDKEAIELRDGDKKRFRGKGVRNAVGNINDVIGPKLRGMPISTAQTELDRLLIELDGTPSKSRLGANAILAVSGAYATIQADEEGLELWQHFAGGNTASPVPQFNVLNAGRHADTGFEVQETLVIPFGADSFEQALEIGTNVWYALKSDLKKAGYSTGRGDEGGFVNPFTSLEATASAVAAAIERAGYKPGKEVMLGFDAAFSEIFGKDLMQDEADPEDRTYHFGGKRYTPEEMAAFWADAAKTHGFASLEDGMAQNDIEGWKLLSRALRTTTQLVLDDCICTNPELIAAFIREGIGNASLIKLNQVGTVSETVTAMEMTDADGRVNVASHRSGETENALLGHFAMHPLVRQIKTGSSGGERNGKHNVLWMAARDLGDRATYRGLDALPASVREHWR